MRSEWDMLFVNGGKAALDALEERDFDIVVSDLRMPQMDGVALLQEVRKRSPRTVRISLSGYSDKEMALRAVSEIHQFLSKPCEAEQLITTLERAIALSNLLSDERLKGLVSQMRTVPSLPALHDEVMRQLDAPDSSLRVIGKAMSQDGGMSSKAL